MNKELVNKNFTILKQYVPIVDRVHSQAHPEFKDVRVVFDKITKKTNKSIDVDLSAEFKSLREITNNYSIPSGVCESYEAVYNMLEELDKIYEEDNK